MDAHLRGFLVITQDLQQERHDPRITEPLEIHKDI